MKIPKNMRVAEFGDHGRGAPRLAMYTRPKSADVQWDYGSLWCQPYQVRAALKQVGGLYQPVQDIWQRWRPHLRGRAALMHGGDDSGIGAICFVPHALAEEVYELVRERYAKAIPILIHYRARKV
jgi:hypothetical protein